MLEANVDDEALVELTDDCVGLCLLAGLLVKESILVEFLIFDSVTLAKFTLLILILSLLRGTVGATMLHFDALDRRQAR